ncbi:hypothetical protein DRO60_03025 [Candidatus Bathyarchaeota archaeon]|nr:MAG: hypothetical protein DRO60_03025 [Candidatus Bathyarchaeota archaeon]
MASPGKAAGAALMGIGVAMTIFTFYVAYTQCLWWAVHEEHMQITLTFGKWGPALAFLCLMAAMGIAFAKIGVDALRTVPPTGQAGPASVAPANVPMPVAITPPPEERRPLPPRPRAQLAPPRERPSPPPKAVSAAPETPTPPEARPRSISEAIRSLPPPPPITEEDLLKRTISGHEEKSSLPPTPPRREARPEVGTGPEGETDLKAIMELLRRKRQERRRS